ncbi:MAG: hypothetical protein Q9213_008275 [Squamulea squamosa]
MSGQGFLGPHNTGRLPPPPRCTVFFYAWTCGHRQWVHCLDCSEAGEPPCKSAVRLLNIFTHLFTQAHLNHPHQERQLPAPRHRCPRCNQWPPHELARGPLLGENLSGLARQSLRSIRQEASEPEIIRVRIAQDVAAVLDPWREPTIPDDIPTGRLRDIIAMNMTVEAQSIRADQQFLQDFTADLDRTPRASQANLVQQPPQVPNGMLPHSVQHAPAQPPYGVHRPNGVYTGGSRGPRGGRGRFQHTTLPRHPSQLRNGYTPEEDESDGQQQQPRGARR